MDVLALTSSNSGRPEELVHRKSSHQLGVKGLCSVKRKGRFLRPLSRNSCIGHLSVPNQHLYL